MSMVCRLLSCERRHDACGWFDLHRCLNCDAVYDALILLNQAVPRPDRSLYGPQRRHCRITRELPAPDDVQDV